MIARDILSRDTAPLSQKPRLGENFAWQVLDWKKPAANDCHIREKSEIKVRLTSGKPFPGQYFDEETGLHYNYFRDYDPSTGRYTTSDPIGLNGGLNTYLYVAGNPINYIDPNGLIGGTINDVGGAIADAGYAGYAHGIQARRDANNAAAKVDRGGMTEGASQYRGPADAIRHCVLACSLTQRLGRSTAMSMLNRHEEFGDDPDLMDDLNNQMGCFLGENGSEKSCEQMCFENYQSLMTGRTPDGAHISRPLPIGEVYR